MATAKNGDSVSVHYTGSLEDGTIFDSSDGREPLEFVIGGNMVVPGFEEAVVGLAVGDKTRATLPPEKAYGSSNPDLIVEVGLDQFPPDVKPEIDQRLHVNDDSGRTIPVRVTAIGATSVTLDANHELAGKTLIFDIELMSIS